jgi:hypothetical protein
MTIKELTKQQLEGAIAMIVALYHLEQNKISDEVGFGFEVFEYQHHFKVGIYWTSELIPIKDKEVTPMSTPVIDEHIMEVSKVVDLGKLHTDIFDLLETISSIEL